MRGEEVESDAESNLEDALLREEERQEYDYDYRRLDSVTLEPALPVTVGVNDEDIPLDWNSPEQRKELAVWWSYAWPTMILFFSTQSYSFVDLAFLGHLDKDSSDSLAAAAQATMLFDITLAIFMRGFLQVLTVLCSQAYGAGKFALVGHWLQLSIAVCCVSGIPILFLWWYSADVLDALVGLQPNIREKVEEFSKWSTLRLYPQLITVSLRQFCLAQKIIKPLVYISVVGLILNVLLNQFFIYGFGSFGGFGFKGSPMATSATATAVFVATYLYIFWWRKDTGKCWPGWTTKSFSAARTKEFLKQGIPLTVATCLEDFQFQTVSVFAIHMSHSQGTWVIGAHNGLMSFLLSTLSFQWGVLKSTTVRAGHYIGAQDPANAKLVGKLAFVVSSIVSLIGGLTLVIFRNHVGKLFSNDEKIVQEVAKLIVPLSVGYVALSMFYISMAMLDSQGRPNVVVLGFLVGAWIFGVPLSYLLGITLDLGLLGLWLGIMAGYGAATAYLVYAVFTTNWEEVIHAANKRNNLGNQSPTFSVISADTNPFPSPVLTAVSPS